MESATPDPLASFRLDDRLIIVTGASQGIGRAFAEAFARAGAQLVLVSRRRDKLEAVRQAIAAQGGRADVVEADISKVADIRKLGDVVSELAQGTDRHLVLVNNAGLGFTKAALDVTEDEWDAQLDIHAKGAFFCSQQIGRLMIERGYGKIINISSTWAVTTGVGKSPYSAAKAAVTHLTAALATEWAPFGVRVNALAPGTTVTEFTTETMKANPERFAQLKSRIKLGRFATPADLVGGAIYLASGASDFMTGHTLFIDGGFTA